MANDIVLAPEAVADLRRVPVSTRAAVMDAIRKHLRHRPTAVSRSRIKRLRGMTHPQFRLRVGEVRVFYDVHAKRVEILAIIPKSGVEEWLERAGE